MTHSVAPEIRVREVAAFTRRAPLRMPFRFGSATMTELTVLYLWVRTASGGIGVSASVLSPLWFDKNPDRDLDTKTRDLLNAVGTAIMAALGAGGTAYELHRITEDALARTDLSPLVQSFGVAMVDNAIVDAVCRQEKTTFHGALQHDLFGFGPLPALPSAPLDRIAVRHTVGLGDPLTAADLPQPLDDGLPETLEDIARAYGHRWFKLKVNGDVAAMCDRLARIDAVLPRDSRVTLDGNEQFTGIEQVVAFAEMMREQLDDLWDRTEWLEQPLARDASLEPRVSRGLRELDKPVLLDESNESDEVVDLALSLGYAGVSAKNCKGVFRTLHSYRAVHERPGILSSEDLTNPAIVAFHQDTCVAAALGIPHTERNAHHYLRGLAFLSPADRELALREHPDLYAERDGLVTLRIEGGAISAESINGFGYGVRSGPDWDALEPLDLEGR